MASITYDDTTSIHTCLNTATQGTTLNGLDATLRAISNSTGDLDNGTDLDLFGDFELDVSLASAPVDGDPIAELYILPSVDDTNFPTSGTSLDPPVRHLAGVFCASGTSTDQRMVIPGISLYPRKMRFLLKNVDTTAFSSDDSNFLKVKPYCLQSS